MDTKRNGLIESLAKRRARTRLLRRAVALACVAVLLLTVNTLKFSAVAMERVADCGYEDHAHGAECYDEAGGLICQRHVHTDACYQAVSVEASEEGPASADSEGMEDLPGEVEIALGGEEEAEDGALQVDEIEDDARPEAEGLAFDFGGRETVTLDELLAALGFEAEIREVGQVVDDAHPDGMLRFDQTDVGLEIRLDALEAELALFTDEDILTVRLMGAAIPAEEAQDEEIPAEDAPSDDETADEGADEIVEADAAAEQDGIDEAVEPVEMIEEAAEEIEASLEPDQQIEAEMAAEPAGEPEAEPRTEAAPETEPEQFVDADDEIIAEPIEEPAAAPTEEIAEEPAEAPTEEITEAPTEEPEAGATPEETVEPEATIEFEATIEPEATLEPEETVEPTYLSGTRTVAVDGADYRLSVRVPEAAQLPADARFAAQAVENAYYSEAAVAAVASEEALEVLALFDLTIYDGAGNVLRPQAALAVSVDFGDALEDDAAAYAVHFPGTGEQPQGAEIADGTPEAIEAVNDDGVVGFEADSFSFYAVVGVSPRAEAAPGEPCDAQFFLYLENSADPGQQATRLHAAAYYTPHFRLTGKVDGAYIHENNGYTANVAAAVLEYPDEAACKAVAKENFRLSDEDLEHIEVVWYAASEKPVYSGGNAIEGHCSGYHVDGYLRWKDDGYSARSIQHLTTITGTLWWFNCQQPESCTVQLLHRTAGGFELVDQRSFGVENSLYDFVWTGLEDDYTSYAMRVVGLSPSVWNVEYASVNANNWRTEPDYSEAFFYGDNEHQDDNYPYYGYKLLAKATKLDDARYGSLRLVKTSVNDVQAPDLTPPETAFTVRAQNGDYELTVKYRDFQTGEGGQRYLKLDYLPLGAYTVTESGADVDRFTLTTDVTDGGVAKLERQGQEAELRFTNRYNAVGLYIQKRFQLNSAFVGNWVRDCNPGAVYFKLRDNANGGFVDDHGNRNDGYVFAITYDDVQPAPGNYAEGGVTYIRRGDRMHYTLYLPNLPQGNYTPCECDANGDHVLTDGNAGYMTCDEMGGKLKLMKNTVVNVTAAKRWDDRGNDYATHPDVSFRLEQQLGNGPWTEVDTKSLSAHGQQPGPAEDGTRIQHPFVEWKDLPLWDIDTGNPIRYRTVEAGATAIPGYRPEGTAVNGDIYGGDDVRHATFTNVLETVEVRVQKKWDGGVPGGARVTLTLSGGGLSIPIRLNGLSDWPENVTGEGWGNDWEHYSAAGNTENAHEGHNWTAVWKGLPKYDGEGREIAYTVVETEGWEGYAPVYAVGNATATSVVLMRNSDAFTGELTNRRNPFLQIKKVGGAGDVALPDCRFALTWTDGAGSHTLMLVSGADGLLTAESGANAIPCAFDTVYTLTETEAASGYRLLTEPITFRFSAAEGRWTVTDENTPGAVLNYKSDADRARPDLPKTGDDTYLAVVANTPGVALPSTGGTGAAGFYFLGMALVLGAALLLIKSRFTGR